jgi:hypothetical protein
MPLHVRLARYAELCVCYMFSVLLFCYAQKKVGVLSGGERNRLQLAKVCCFLIRLSPRLEPHVHGERASLTQVSSVHWCKAWLRNARRC